MLFVVVEVNPKADFQLDLVYANGERRRFDMRPLLSIVLYISVENVLAENVTKTSSRDWKILSAR